jgi:hypothetical protein
MSYITTADVEPMADDPAAVESAATSLRATAEPLRSAGADVETHWQGLGGVYEAPEQGVLFGAVAPVRAAGDDLATSIEQIADALAAYAEALAPLKAMRDQLYTDVGEFGIEVATWHGEDGNGSESWTSNPDFVSRDQSLRRSASGITSAILDAERDCAGAIGAVSGGTGSGLGAVDDAQAAAIARPGAWQTVLTTFDANVDAAAMTTLERLAAMDRDELDAWVADNEERMHQLIDAPPSAEATETWWNGVDPATQALMVSSASLLVGNLDGVPWNRRIEANHNGLRSESERLRRLIDGVPAHPSDERRAQADAWAAELRLYDGLLEEQSTVVAADGSTTTTEGAHVIVFDPSREAVAVYVGGLGPDGGIPASTRDVGVYVPGTGSLLSNADGSIDKATTMANAAMPPGSLGMLAWQGGHFPQGAEAANSAASEDLAPRLSRLVNAVDHHESTTVTAVGYSYGGAVVGMAEKEGMDVDRVLHVSSAGLGHGIRDLDQYPETADVPHYAMLAPFDPIVGGSQGLELPGTGIGHGGSPVDTPGVTRLETGFNDASAGQESGPMRGHFNWWSTKSSAFRQVMGVLTGGDVEPFVEDPEGESHKWDVGVDDLPIMQDDYRRRTIAVETGQGG